MALQITNTCRSNGIIHPGAQKGYSSLATAAWEGQLSFLGEYMNFVKWTQDLACSRVWRCLSWIRWSEGFWHQNTFLSCVKVIVPMVHGNELCTKLWDPTCWSASLWVWIVHTIQAMQQNLNVKSPNFPMTFLDSVSHVTKELFHRLLFVVVWRVQWSNQPKARIPAAWTASFEATIHPSTPSGVKRMKIQQL